MEHPIYTSLKVNNEIELCAIADMDVKQKIERALLKNRISYYVRWVKPSLFRHRPETCIFCVNSNDKDLAEQVILSLNAPVEKTVTFLSNKSNNNFF